MYLTLRSFLIILITGLFAVGFLITAAFTTSNSTVAVNNTPPGRIVLVPLTTQPVRASESFEVAPEQALEAPTEPMVEPAQVLTKKSNPVMKVATSSVQAAPMPTVTCSGTFANEFLCLLNQYRTSKGKGKLSGSSALSKVALTHSTWMASTGIFSHTGENNTRLGDRCKAAGISCRAENLAHNADSAQDLLNMWKASPSHNTNLLGNYSTAGLAISGSYITLLLN